MKNTYIIAALVAVALVGYFFFVRNPLTTSETPTTGDTSAKLDMNVVCESALAYMSFPDSASADVFVKECIEGKYPEVVERYKAQMNVGEGAAI
jgi:hypothetical protein